MKEKPHIIGKWYKRKGSSRYGRCLTEDDNYFYFNELIDVNGSYVTGDFNWDIRNTDDVNIDVIKRLLPDNYVAPTITQPGFIPISALVQEEIYAFAWENNTICVFKFESSNAAGDVIYGDRINTYMKSHSGVNFKSKGLIANSDMTSIIRSATTDEIKWLNYCVKVDKGVSKAEALEKTGETSFITGKWYKSTYNSGSCRYIKFAKLIPKAAYNELHYSESIEYDKYSNVSNYIANEQLERSFKLLDNLSEIQQYLPVGHVDEEIYNEPKVVNDMAYKPEIPESQYAVKCNNLGEWAFCLSKPGFHTRRKFSKDKMCHLYNDGYSASIDELKRKRTNIYSYTDWLSMSNYEPNDAYMKSLLKEATLKYPIGTEYYSVVNKNLGIVRHGVFTIHYRQINGDDNEGVLYKDGKWAKIVEPAREFKVGDKLVGKTRMGSIIQNGTNPLGVKNQYYICDRIEHNTGTYELELWANGAFYGCDEKDISLYTEVECLPKVGDLVVVTEQYYQNKAKVGNIGHVIKVTDSGYFVSGDGIQSEAGSFCSEVRCATREESQKFMTINTITTTDDDPLNVLGKSFHTRYSLKKQYTFDHYKDGNYKVTWDLPGGASDFTTYGLDLVKEFIDEKSWTLIPVPEGDVWNMSPLIPEPYVSEVVTYPKDKPIILKRVKINC